MRCCVNHPIYPNCEPGSMIINTTFNHDVFEPRLTMFENHYWDPVGENSKIAKGALADLDPQFSCTMVDDSSNLFDVVHCLKKSRLQDINKNDLSLTFFMCSFTEMNGMLPWISGLFNSRNLDSNVQNNITPVIVNVPDLLTVSVDQREIKISWHGDLPARVRIKKLRGDFYTEFDLEQRDGSVTLPSSEIYVSGAYEVSVSSNQQSGRSVVFTRPIYDCLIRQGSIIVVVDFAECQKNYFRNEVSWIFMFIILTMVIFFILKYGFIFRFFSFVAVIIMECFKIRILSMIASKMMYYFTRVPTKQEIIINMKKFDTENNLSSSEIEKELEHVKSNEEFNKEKKIMLKSMIFPNLKGELSKEEIEETKKAIDFDFDFMPFSNSSHMISVDMDVKNTIKKLKENQLDKSDYIKEVGLKKFKPMNLIIDDKKWGKAKEKPKLGGKGVVFTKRGIFRILILMSMIVFGFGSSCTGVSDFLLKNKICQGDTGSCRVETFSQFVFTSVGEIQCITGTDKSKNTRFYTEVSLSSNFQYLTPTFSYLTSEYVVIVKSASHCRWTIFSGKNVCNDGCNSNSKCDPIPLLHETEALKSPCFTGCRTGVEITNQVCFWSKGCLAESENVVLAGSYFSVYGGFISEDRPSFEIKNYQSNKISSSVSINVPSGSSKTIFENSTIAVDFPKMNNILYGKCILFSNVDQVSKRGRRIKKGSMFITECSETGSVPCEKVGNIEVDASGRIIYNMQCINKVYSSGNTISISPVEPLSDFLDNAIDYSSTPYNGLTFNNMNDGRFSVMVNYNLFFEVSLNMQREYSAVINDYFEAQFIYIPGSMRGLFGAPKESASFKLKNSKLIGKGMCELYSKEITIMTRTIMVEYENQEFIIDFFSKSADVRLELSYECSSGVYTITVIGVLSKYIPRSNNDTAVTVVTSHPQQTGFKFKFLNFLDLENKVINSIIIILFVLFLVIFSWLVSVVVRRVRK